MRSTVFRDDRELILAVIGGDPQAADEFVVRFSRFVYAGLYRNSRMARESAEDLYQQVFVHLWENDCRRLRLWRGEGDFAAYLGPIVRNLALSQGRRDAREPAIDPEPEETFDQIVDREPSPEELAAVEEERRQVERVVEGLDARARALYRLRFVEGRKHREIAEELGMETGAVGVALVRLERRLARDVPEIRENKEVYGDATTGVRSESTGASPEERGARKR